MTHQEFPRRLTRRSALTAFIGAGATLALGCGNSSSTGGADAESGAGSSGTGTGGTTGAGGTGNGGTSAAGAGGARTDGATSTGGTTASDGGDCAATAEGEIGPYFADDSDARFNRSNILTNIDGTNLQTGIPLTLTVTIVDTEKACAPYVGAQIDIWHCNASGVYSDQSVENTTTETWLRGYQITDGEGQVTFVTIIPGWYQGRTTHIHLRVRSTYSNASSTSDGTNTTQLFFDQTFVDTLDTSVAPYNAEGKNSTTNVSDHVYTDEMHGENLMTVTGDDTNGYTAAVTIYLPITSEGTSTTTGPTGGPPGGP